MDEVEQHYRDYLIKEMHNYRTNVQHIVSQIVHPTFSEDFCTILAKSFFEEDKSALNIAYSLGLESIDFAAYLKDLTSFEEFISQKKESGREYD
jgi:hypothetical protein